MGKNCSLLYTHKISFAIFFQFDINIELKQIETPDADDGKWMSVHIKKIFLFRLWSLKTYLHLIDVKTNQQFKAGNFSFITTHWITLQKNNSECSKLDS